MMTGRKGKSGGKRDGAGRPPAHQEHMIPVVVYLKAETIIGLRLRGKGVSTQVREIVEREIDPDASQSGSTE